MTSWWRRMAVLIVGAVLAGCAAVGPSFQEVERSFPTLRAGTGRIIFYRVMGVGPAVRPDIRLNGEVVGASQANSFFFVDRPAGRYTATARTEVEASLEVPVRDGETVYVQSSITMGLFVGHPRLTLQGTREAVSTLPQLAYIGMQPLAPVRAAGAGGGGLPAGSRSDAAPPSALAPVARPFNPPSGVTMDDLRGLLPAARP